MYFPYIFLTFILYCILEILLMGSFADAFGGFTLFLEIILSMVAGGYLVRSQFDKIARANPEEMREKPVYISDIILSVIAGILLIAPGLITDMIGLLMGWSYFRFKASSLFARSGAMDYTKDRIFKDRFDFDPDYKDQSSAQKKPKTIIEGQYREIDEDHKNKD